MANIAIYTFNSSTDTLPTFNDGFTYEYTDVDNGDGTITRTITSDSLPSSISFEEKTGLVSLSYLNTSNVTDISNMFRSCSNLTTIFVNDWDVSNVTLANDMFFYCTSLSSFDGSKWNTSNFTNIAGMFNGCHALESVILANWDTRNITALQYMFYGCKKLKYINLANLDVSGVTSVNSLFYNCYELEVVDMTGWSLESLELSENMFYDCNNIITIVMNDSDVTSIDTIISEIPTTAENKINIIAGGVDTSSLDQTTITEKNISVNNKYDIVTYKFNTNTSTLPTFNSGFVYEQSDIVNDDGTTTRSIIGYSLPTSLNFKNCTGLTEIISINVDKITNASYMFYGCSNLMSVNLEGFVNNTNIKNMEYMFRDCTKLSMIDVSRFNTANVTSTCQMFYMCTNVTMINGLREFNTSSVTNMEDMFGHCTSLTSLDLSNWNTSNVTNMLDMFYNCNNLASLDLSNFDTSKVTDMGYMFNGCDKLTTLNISNFNTSNVTNMDNLFNKCSNLNLIEMKNSNVDSINSIINKIPTRTEASPGTLKTGNILASSVDETTANSKCWNVDDNSIAIYTFNSSTDTLPAFNDGFTYSNTDVDNGDDTITRTIISDSLPSSISFNDKTGLVSLSYLDTSNVTDMYCMFYGCINLISIDLSSFDTSIVTDMSSMFSNCKNLTTIECLSNFNTSKVINMSYMFNGCDKLTSLNLSNWDIGTVSNFSDFFNGCTNLKKVIMDNSNVSSINKIIGVLPTRTSIGKLYAINVIDTSTIDKNTADSNNWKIVIKENLVTKTNRIYTNSKSVKIIYNNGELFL